MKEYLLLFRTKTDGARPTPDQIQARKAWFGGIVSQGKLADKGNTLSPTEARLVGSDGAVMEGPSVSHGEIVSGYVVVKADGIDAAVDLAKTNPIFQGGGSIEVREVSTFLSGSQP